MSKQNLQDSAEEAGPMLYDRRDKVCEICGKRVKHQGYGGHLFLAHDVKTGVVARLEEVQKRLNDLENSRDGRPALKDDDDARPVSVVKKIGKEPQPFSSVIEDLSAQLESAREEREDIIDRLESVEAFIGRIFGKEGFWSDNLSLVMSLEDWKKTEAERDTEEGDEESAEEGEEEAEDEDGEK